MDGEKIFYNVWSQVADRWNVSFWNAKDNIPILKDEKNKRGVMVTSGGRQTLKGIGMFDFEPGDLLIFDDRWFIYRSSDSSVYLLNQQNNDGKGLCVIKDGKLRYYPLPEIKPKTPEEAKSSARMLFNWTSLVHSWDAHNNIPKLQAKSGEVYIVAKEGTQIIEGVGEIDFKLGDVLIFDEKWNVIRYLQAKVMAKETKTEPLQCGMQSVWGIQHSSAYMQTGLESSLAETIHEIKPQYLSFSEALNKMKEGKHVGRVNPGREDPHHYFMAKETLNGYFLTKPILLAVSNHSVKIIDTLPVEDIIANDWVEV